jgi:hypothetical protein
MDRSDRKLHLSLSDLACQRLEELKVVYSFASRRSLATYILEKALENQVPSGLPKPLNPAKGKPGE